MMAPLRARHRRATRLLAVVLPMAFAGAIVARPGWPMETGDEGAPATSAGRGTPIAEGDLDVRLWREADALVVEPQADPRRPDVLVYWSAEPSTTAAGPPQGSLLLGVLAGARTRRFELPGPARSGAGTLIFHSLAHGEVVGTAPVPTPRSE